MSSGFAATALPEPVFPVHVSSREPPQLPHDAVVATSANSAHPKVLRFLIPFNVA
jgi:hypothetical protein